MTDRHMTNEELHELLKFKPIHFAIGAGRNFLRSGWHFYIAFEVRPDLMRFPEEEGMEFLAAFHFEIEVWRTPRYWRAVPRRWHCATFFRSDIDEITTRIAAKAQQDG